MKWSRLVLHISRPVCCCNCLSVSCRFLLFSQLVLVWWNLLCRQRLRDFLSCYKVRLGLGCLRQAVFFSQNWSTSCHREISGTWISQGSIQWQCGTSIGQAWKWLQQDVETRQFPVWCSSSWNQESWGEISNMVDILINNQGKLLKNNLPWLNM